MIFVARKKQEKPEEKPTQTMGGSPGELGEELVMQEKQKKGWRTNCDIREATDGLGNEL